MIWRFPWPYSLIISKYLHYSSISVIPFPEMNCWIKLQQDIMTWCNQGDPKRCQLITCIFLLASQTTHACVNEIPRNENLCELIILCSCTWIWTTPTTPIYMRPKGSIKHRRVCYKYLTNWHCSGCSRY